MNKSAQAWLAALAVWALYVAGEINTYERRKYNDVVAKVQSGVTTLLCGEVPKWVDYDNPPDWTIVTKNPDWTYTIAIAKPTRWNHSSQYEVRSLSEVEANEACKVKLK